MNPRYGAFSSCITGPCAATWNMTDGQAIQRASSRCASCSRESPVDEGELRRQPRSPRSPHAPGGQSLLTPKERSMAEFIQRIEARLSSKPGVIAR